MIIQKPNKASTQLEFDRNVPQLESINSEAQKVNIILLSKSRNICRLHRMLHKGTSKTLLTRLARISLELSYTPSLTKLLPLRSFLATLKFDCCLDQPQPSSHKKGVATWTRKFSLGRSSFSRLLSSQNNVSFSRLTFNLSRLICLEAAYSWLCEWSIESPLTLFIAALRRIFFEVIHHSTPHISHKTSNCKSACHQTQCLSLLLKETASFSPLSSPRWRTFHL